MSDSTAQNLQQELNQLAKKGKQHLFQLRHRHALEQGWNSALASIWAFPVLILLAVILSLFEVISFDIPLFCFIGVVVFPALIFIWYYWQVAKEFEIDRRLALALYDHHLGAKDRLQTADEFLAIETPTEFERAAIKDAIVFVAKAQQIELPKKELSGAKLSFAKWRSLATAVTITVIAIVLPFINIDFSTELDEKHITASQLVASTQPVSKSDESPSSKKAQEKKVVFTQQLTNSSSESEESADQQTLKSKPSLPKAASSAASKNSEAKQNQSETAGSGASSQSSTSKKQQNKKEKPASKKKNAKPKQQQKFTEKQNASAAGVANGKGNTSGQQPANSNKAAAENRARQEDESDNTDEAEEEEDEEQKANSSSGSKKNKRKAPADRKLSISGQSDGENEKANGRSGQGGLKKTRGVAAMLLGVPMPDRLQGTPNPGRTKSIQEQSQPQRQQVAQVTSQGHGQRKGTVGEVPEKPLMPWIRKVISNYFVAQRSDESIKQ